MKKVKLCVILACCATLLLSSCSNMLDSLEKAAETKESTKTEKAEETGNPENTQPLPPAPVTPPAQNPEENKPQEQNPENQNPPEQNPVTPPNDNPQGEEKITYTIKHYKQNIEDDEYTLIEDATETKELTKMNTDADTYGKGFEKTFEGFTANLTLGSDNVVIIKYERNTVRFTFDADGGKWSDGKSSLVVEGKNGRPVTVPENPSKITDEIDYKFAGWDKTIPSVFGTEAKSFKASWVIEKTLCRIEHYKQNLLDDEYTKVDADSQEMKLPQMYEASDVPIDYVKDYEGFEYSYPVLNNQCIICYYYDRKTTALTLNPNGGKFLDGTSNPSIINCKYESTFSIGSGEARRPSKEGYELIGWAYESDAATCDYSQNLNFEITNSTPSAVTLFAIWRPDAAVNGSLNFISGGDVEIVADGNIYEARPTIEGTYTYEWYLNNEKQTVTENRIDLSQLTAGYYILTVKATNTETGVVYVSNFFQPIVF